MIQNSNSRYDEFVARRAIGRGLAWAETKASPSQLETIARWNLAEIVNLSISLRDALRSITRTNCPQNNAFWEILTLGECNPTDTFIYYFIGSVQEAYRLLQYGFSVEDYYLWEIASRDFASLTTH